jgi:hypothetical protein
VCGCTESTIPVITEDSKRNEVVAADSAIKSARESDEEGSNAVVDSEAAHIGSPLKIDSQTEGKGCIESIAEPNDENELEKKKKKKKDDKAKNKDKNKSKDSEDTDLPLLSKEAVVEREQGRIDSILKMLFFSPSNMVVSENVVFDPTVRYVPFVTTNQSYISFLANSTFKLYSVYNCFTSLINEKDEED